MGNESELFRLLSEGGPGVAIELAKSKYATESLLDELILNPSIVVRHEVAKNRNTSINTLESLLHDRDMLVRDYAKRTLMLKVIEIEKEIEDGQE